jgi:hypothetical protein
MDRQQLIEDGSGYPPVLLFAESGCNNNKYIFKYRRGAFSSLKTVSPYGLDYRSSMVTWDYACFNNLDLLVILMSYGTFTHYINCMPAFQPNDYLFEHHADKGEEKWEIMAWAVRDLTAKSHKLEKSEIALREKLIYNEYMYGRRQDLPRYTDKQNEVNGDIELKVSKNIKEPMLDPSANAINN